MPEPTLPDARSAEVLHLNHGGTSLLVRVSDDALPCVLHWGAELPTDGLGSTTDLLAATYVPTRDSVVYQHPWAALLPQQTDGWVGRPGLLGSRAGRGWAPTWAGVEHELDTHTAGTLLRSTAVDPRSGIEVVTELEVLPSGLVRVRAIVTNTGDDGYRVDALEPALPVPHRANELLDMAGRHTRERTPQRRPFGQGQWNREAWGGRPGHDAATVLCAGRAGFGWRSGEVWGVHLAWSGNQVLTAEHAPSGWRLLRGGELLLPDEVVLAQGESYTSPWLVGSWGEGLDAFSHRFHDHLRSRPHHPQRPRPVLLNTWEAAYFDLDTARLVELAEHAAALGIERFVLDDGWFRGRRDDTTSLGDWVVDHDVFPDGLAPVAKAVHGLGMDLGIWVEPEMVSLDSDLARAHPEWVLQTDAGVGVPSRHQHVLDLTRRDAFEHVLGQISAVVAEHDVAFLKWDHNRPVVAPGSGPEHRPGAHAQTRAAYRLMDALRRRHPALEIEACAGGGGRLDLGMIEHTDRVWVSDCIDAHERHRMVPFTGLTLPLELMGTHVGSGTDHSTGRRHTLAFRAGTALWGHLGVEWDLASIDDEDRTRLAAWIAVHKRFRPLLHSGRVVHADLGDPALQLDGVVAADSTEALFRISALDTTLGDPAGRVGLPGLEPDATYEVSPVPESLPVDDRPRPSWFDGVRLPGRVLDRVGLTTPRLLVDDLVLVHARLVDRT